MSFENELSALCARHASASKGDPDAMANMIERLSASLGFTIALTADGDPATIDKLVMGMEAYTHEEAVAKARVLAFIARHT